MNTTNNHDTAYFSEFQRFTSKFFIYIVIIVEPLIIVGLFFVLQNTPELMIVVGLTAFLPIVILLLALNTKLESYIDRNIIRFKWSPFQKSYRKITWQEIAEAKVIDHGFIGHGWRISQKYGNVHNVKGNKGLFIKLKNGSKYLIGTQKPEELQHILSKLHYGTN